MYIDKCPFFLGVRARCCISLEGELALGILRSLSQIVLFRQRFLHPENKFNWYYYRAINIASIINISLHGLLLFLNLQFIFQLRNQLHSVVFFFLDRLQARFVLLQQALLFLDRKSFTSQDTINLRLRNLINVELHCRGTHKPWRASAFPEHVRSPILSSAVAVRTRNSSVAFAVCPPPLLPLAV